MNVRLSIVPIALALAIGCKPRPAEEPGPTSMATAGGLGQSNGVTIDASSLDMGVPELIAKARSCVGKTKAVAVEILGEPRRVWKSSLRDDSFYVFFIARTDVTATYTKQGKISIVTLGFRKRALAGDVWQALNNPPKNPTVKLPEDDTLVRFTAQPNEFRREDVDVSHGFETTLPLEFSYQFSDGVWLTFRGFSDVLPVAGEVKFNTETDQREFISHGANPAFDWKKTKIQEIKFWRYPSRS